MPKRAAILLLAFLLSALAAAAFIFLFDPELKLTTGVIERKRAWAQRCDRLFPNKTVVYGGSSCAFSLDGEQLEHTHLTPTVNMGAGAGLGPTMLTQLALPVCRDGDTLVIALEAGLITRPVTPLMSATHLAYALGERDLLDSLTDPPRSRLARLPSELLNLRPDATRTCALLGKLALGQPLYRYRIEEVEPSGYQWTDVRVPLAGPPDQGPGLSEDARALFAFLRDYAAARRIRVRYSLPWAYCPIEAERARRRQNLALVREISEFVPVLFDPVLGAQTDASMFADTVHHLTREAAKLRTAEFAAQLNGDEVWTPKLLEAAQLWF